MRRPYSWHLTEESGRVHPEAYKESATGDRAVLFVTLVDAASGIVAAVRAVSFSPHFTRKLHQAMEGQIAAGWRGKSDYDARISVVYGKYPRPRAMLKSAVAQAKGGA